MRPKSDLFLEKKQLNKLWNCIDLFWKSCFRISESCVKQLKIYENHLFSLMNKMYKCFGQSCHVDDEIDWVNKSKFT